MPETGEP